MHDVKDMSISFVKAVIKHMCPEIDLRVMTRLMQSWLSFDDALIFDSPRVVIHCFDFIKSLSFECDVFKLATVPERRLPDDYHTARDNHALKAGAVVKSSPLKDCHSIRNHHAHQAAAIVERPFHDARHAVWNRHTLQSSAARERLISDSRHAVWNDN